MLQQLQIPLWPVLNWSSRFPNQARQKDTYRENAPSNKAKVFMKSMNMDIWVVSTLNQLFMKGPYDKINFEKIT